MDLTDWERRVLENAREVYDHGEGIATFKVTNETGKRMWKAEITLTSRGEEKFLDKGDPIA